MSITQIQETLKNMSGDELAQTQNAVIVSSELDDDDRAAAIALIGQELQVRQTEGLGRKTGRFLNRHGEKIGLVAIGAVLGVQLGDGVN